MTHVDVPKLALRPCEAARAIGISERHLWAMTARGEVPHVRLGGRIVYPVAALEAWLDRAASGASTAEAGNHG